MTGFGLAHLKMEGAAMHPDDFSDGICITDEQYERQLRAHYITTGQPFYLCMQDGCSRVECHKRVLAQMIKEAVS